MSTATSPAGGPSSRRESRGDRHAYAIAALILGVIGTLVGFVWFGYLVSFTCGAVAIAFALIAGRGSAPRVRRLAIVGGVLGVAALALSGYGFATFLGHADESATPEAAVPEPQER